MTETNTPENLVPYLVITIGEDKGQFKATNSDVPQLILWEQALASKANDGMAGIASVVELVQYALGDDYEEYQKFRAFLLKHNSEDDLVGPVMDALNALWNGESLLPLEQESTDLPEPTTPTDSSSTQNSSEQDTEEEKPKKRGSKGSPSSTS